MNLSKKFGFLAFLVVSFFGAAFSAKKRRIKCLEVEVFSCRKKFNLDTYFSCRRQCRDNSDEKVTFKEACNSLELQTIDFLVDGFDEKSIFSEKINVKSEPIQVYVLVKVEEGDLIYIGRSPVGNVCSIVRGINGEVPCVRVKAFGKEFFLRKRDKGFYLEEVKN